MLGVAVNKQTMAWAGPADWQQRFKEMTYRSCHTTGAEYFAAEDAERLAEYRLLAAKQKNYPTDASLHGCRAQDSAEVVLAGQARVRLEDYLALKDEHQSLGGVFICDLDQNAEGSWKRCGERWPCMLTHGFIVGITEEWAKLATGMEHVGALGWHLFPSTTTQHAMSSMRGVFEKCSSLELKVLAGRGIHLPCLSSWMYFALSNVIRKPKDMIERPIAKFSEDSES